MDEFDFIVDSGDKGNEKRPRRSKKSQPVTVTHTSRTRWGWLIILGILIGAVILGLQLASQNRVQPQPGETAPAFGLTTYDGQVVSSESLRGKIVLLNFWADWCAPCHGEAPDIQDIAEDYTGKNVVVLGINWLDPDTDAFRFINTYGLTYLNGPDVGEKIAQTYRIEAAPETYIIDRDGIIAETIIGPTTYEHLSESLDALIASGGSSS